MDEREHEQQLDLHYGEKPFASIRESGQNLQRGSQMSLNNTRNGFKRLGQRHGLFFQLFHQINFKFPDIDIYGASNMGLNNLPPSAFYNNLIANDSHQRLINSSSSFHPITRSTLSVFTQPNGRQQAQKRSMAVHDMGSPFEQEQATVTTTTSPNNSSGSSPKQLPPPLPLPLPPRTNLRAATSSMELSNSFRGPAQSTSMRTFGNHASNLSQSQLYDGF